MPDTRRRSVPFVIAALLLAGAVAEAADRPNTPLKLATTTARPAAFGTSAYTVASISGLAFTALHPSEIPDTDGTDYFRYMSSPSGGHFVTGAIVPAGAVIDYIGLGLCDGPGGSFVLDVYESSDTGSYVPIGAFLSGAHPTGCTTEYNATAIGYQILGNAAHSVQVAVFHVPGAPTDGSVRFGSVEIWWRLTVSPQPVANTFLDVPTNHPFFQYVQALSTSGITAGCGGGNFCPDAALTRGQMAVFLSKALGLHWPGNGP